MAKMAETSKMAKITKLTKMIKITTAAKMAKFSKLAEMAEVSKVAKFFKITKFAQMDKISQIAGFAQTIKRDFNGRRSQDSHNEQNDLSDQYSQIGPRWPGLAKKGKMAKLTEFDSIAKNSKKNELRKSKIG